MMTNESGAEPAEAEAEPKLESNDDYLTDTERRTTAVDDDWRRDSESPDSTTASHAHLGLSSQTSAASSGGEIPL